MDEGFKSTIWTPAENKLFENALAEFDKDTPDRWRRVAEMVPGKTVADVMRQYKELEDDVCNIEAGFYPKYWCKNLGNTCPFTLELGNGYGFEESKSPPYCDGGMRSPKGGAAAGRPIEPERKKGIPWTEEEHKMFLLGLKKCGKGDWRNISRNFVETRTPTQVASHAQKYFIRQLSNGKDKRRASIHDMTIVNVNESQNSQQENKRTSPEKCRSRWNPTNNGGGGASATFHQTRGNIFMSSQCIGNVMVGGDGDGDGDGGGGGGGLNRFYGAP